jgi:hypothetical protein
MKNLKIYKLVKNIPEEVNIALYRWIFRYKFNSENTINKIKAWWVACGFNQKQGINYNETYSLTLKQESLRRIVIALSV